MTRFFSGSPNHFGDPDFSKRPVLRQVFGEGSVSGPARQQTGDTDGMAVIQPAERLHIASQAALHQIVFGIGHLQGSSPNKCQLESCLFRPHRDFRRQFEITAKTWAFSSQHRATDLLTEREEPASARTNYTGNYLLRFGIDRIELDAKGAENGHCRCGRR